MVQFGGVGHLHQGRAAFQSIVLRAFHCDPCQSQSIDKFPSAKDPFPKDRNHVTKDNTSSPLPMNSLLQVGLFHPFYRQRTHTLTLSPQPLPLLHKEMLCAIFELDVSLHESSMWSLPCTLTDDGYERREGWDIKWCNSPIQFHFKLLYSNTIFSW